MKFIATKAAAIGLAALMCVSSFAPVQAQDNALSYSQRQQVVQAYCSKYPQDQDCNGWWFWGAREYDAFYYRNRTDLEPLIAGIFGLAIGAIIGGAIANSNKHNSTPAATPSRLDPGHVARCAQRYKSYDHHSDTYLGHDGMRHACNL